MLHILSITLLRLSITLHILSIILHILSIILHILLAFLNTFLYILLYKLNSTFSVIVIKELFYESIIGFGYLLFLHLEIQYAVHIYNTYDLLTIDYLFIQI